MDAKERRVVVSMVTVTAAILLSGAASLGSSVLVVRLDAVGSLIELVALGVTYVALRRAKAAPSDDYNYGLGKLENLCGLLFAQVQIVYLAVFVWLAIGRLGAPAPPQGAGWGVLLYVYGATVTGLMMRWSGALNRESPSPVAQSLWRGYQIKFWANVTTGLVLALVALFPDLPMAEYLDPLNVLALCALRMRNIHRMLKESGRDLLDAAVDEHVRLIILRELARRFDAYDDLLGYETRRSPGVSFVTIHLGFTPDRPLTDVFEAVESLTRAIEAHVAGGRVSVVPHKVDVPAAAGTTPAWRETV